MFQNHSCKLTKPVMPPIHPGSGIFKRFVVSLKPYLMVNQKDLRSQKFFRTGSAIRAEQRRQATSKFSFIIHPFSKVSFIVDSIYCMLFFERVILFMFRGDVSFRTWHIIGDSIQFILMICYFFTGYGKWKIKRTYLHPSKCVLNYLKSWFLVDFYMLFENYHSILYDSLATWLYPQYVVHFNLFIFILSIGSILCYVFRLFYCLRFLENAVITLGCSKFAMFIATHLIVFAFLIHIFAFEIIYIPWQIYYYQKYFPEDSFMVLRKLNTDHYTLNAHIECILIVLTFFLGVEYAETIKQPVELLLLFIFSFIGRIYVLIMIAKVLLVFGFADTGESEYENLFLQLDNYMNSMDAPDHLRKQIVETFEFHYRKKYFNVKELMNILTNQLKTELFLFGAKKLTILNGLLSKMSNTDLALIFSKMKSDVYAKNEIILGAFTERNAMFFISSGMVSVYDINDVELYHLADGDEFGLDGIVPKYEKNYVVAIETTEVYYIKKIWIRKVVSTNSHLVKYFQDLIKKRLEMKRQAILQKIRGGESVAYNMAKGRILQKRHKIDLYAY